MSSIHDALRRAEREREIRLSVATDSLVPSGSRHRKRVKLWVPAAVTAAVICLAPALYSWLDSETPRRGGHGKPNVPRKEASIDGTSLVPEPVHSMAAEADPEEGLKLFRMGRVMHRTGRLQEARSLYEEALSISPALVEAKNNLGVVLLSLKDYSSAEKAFLDVIGHRPDYVDSQYNLACLYSLTGRMDEALSALTHAVELDPEALEWALMDKDLGALREAPGFHQLVEGRTGSDQ